MMIVIYFFQLVLGLQEQEEMKLAPIKTMMNERYVCIEINTVTNNLKYFFDFNRFFNLHI